MEPFSGDIYNIPEDKNGIATSLWKKQYEPIKMKKDKLKRLQAIRMNLKKLPKKAQETELHTALNNEIIKLITQIKTYKKNEKSIDKQS